MPENDTEPGSEIKNDLETLADLCAVGSAPIPFDLPPSELQQLMRLVGNRRRKRLLNLIAASIARDILREQRNYGGQQDAHQEI